MQKYFCGIHIINMKAQNQNCASYLDDAKEEHDKNEDGVDELVQPQLGVVVDDP